MTRSKVDEQFGTIRPAIEAYYQLLDHTVRSLEYPLVDVKRDLPELYEAFCLLFKTLNDYYKEEVNDERI